MQELILIPFIIICIAAFIGLAIFPFVVIWMILDWLKRWENEP